MTAAALKTYSHKDLAQLAKKRGVHGWHAMRKEELVRALLRLAKKSAEQRKSPTAAKKSLGTTVYRDPKKSAANKTPPASSNGLHQPPVEGSNTNSRVLRKIEEARAKMLHSKDLSSAETRNKNGVLKDRLVAMVRGPYWLHCYWDITPQSVQRAQAALGQDWHSAAPILRVSKVDTATAGASESVERDIKIHGRVKNWYVDVLEAQQNYRLEVGYLAATGRFYGISRSNIVSTPAADRVDLMDPHWTDVAENCEKIYAMSGGYAPEGGSPELQELFEERLRRPMGSPSSTRYGAEGLLSRTGRLKVELEAELMVHGATQPDAFVTLQGEPIKVRADGSFTVRCDFPNRRQVIPVVISTRDGAQQRTVVLAVERNTKILEPVMRESAPADLEEC